MILGWKIASIVITSLYFINLILKLLINKTNILNKIFATKISQIIHYLFYIIVNYSLIVILVLAHFLSGLNLGFYILGVVFSICLIFSMLDTLLKDLSGQRPKNRFGALTPIYKLGCILDFIVFIFISVILLYNISDNVLQNILITIYSAVVGGSLTLIGVLISIKNQEKIRQEDQKLLYKPNFTFETIDDLENVEHNVYMKKIEKSVLANGKKDKKLLPNERYYRLKNFKLINTDHSNFVIEKFEVNNKNMLDNHVLIKKQEKVIFKGNILLINDDKTIPNFKIYLKDFLENHYICNLSFDIIEEELPFKNGERDKSGNRVEENLKVKEMLLKNIELRELN